VASVSVANSQQLSVSPYDKSSLGDIERAIVESNLGLTPNNDGDLIRINIPAITEDRRKELMKNCKSLGEDGKVAIRNIRRDGVEVVKKMEKASDIGEDESKGAQDKIQKLTDQYVKEIDTLIAAKEKDVMTV
jgi:ribosome recycling factor